MKALSPFDQDYILIWQPQQELNVNHLFFGSSLRVQNWSDGDETAASDGESATCWGGELQEALFPQTALNCCEHYICMQTNCRTFRSVTQSSLRSAGYLIQGAICHYQQQHWHTCDEIIIYIYKTCINHTYNMQKNWQWSSGTNLKIMDETEHNIAVIQVRKYVINLQQYPRTNESIVFLFIYKVLLL